MALLIAMIFVSAGAATGEEKKKVSGIISFYLENDVFAGRDHGYTNGVKFIWVSPAIGEKEGDFPAPGWICSLSRKLSFFQPTEATRFISLSAGQNMYTPVDIESRQLLVNDRPYAGIAYLAFGFHSKSMNSMDTVEFQAGIVGPISLAGDVQEFIHKLFRWRTPNGWHNQLKNEPFLGIVLDHKRRLFRMEKTGHIGCDAIWHGGGGLSNVLSGVNSGLEIRAGWNLPTDLGTSVIQPGTDSSSLFEERDARLAGRSLFGIHFFIAFEARSILNNIFLDGNNFRKSHSVEKIPTTADLVTGISFRYKRLRLNYSYAFQTKQFEGQKKKPAYGSLNISFNLKK